MSEIKLPVRVPMRELKAGLSRYVAQARAGRVFDVTLHDKPVARMVGIAAVSSSGVARLIASGAAQWQGGKPSLRPVIKLASQGASLSDMALEGRG